jgi:hypothetical protein
MKPRPIIAEKNVHLRRSRSSASRHPLLWCDLHRRANADAGLLSRAGDYAISNSDQFRNGAEVDKMTR